jgi:Ca2+-binding EF-hand superfamily protein
MKAMTSQPKDKINHRTMHHVFKKYDRKGKGYITFNDLKEMSKLLGEQDDD